MILGGTTIGNNVIIGANSVVTGMIESDSVYAGNPAKRIMSLDEFFNKRKDRQLYEAVEFVREFQKRYGCVPEERYLKEYFFLFANEDNLCPEFEFQLNLLGNRDLSIEKMKGSQRFQGYNAFLKFCEFHD